MNAKLTTEDVKVDKNENTASEKEKEVEGSKDIFTYKFKKPVYHNDEQIDTMTFDWGGLTGKDSLDIDTEARHDNLAIALRAYSEYYLVRMAARANDKKAGVDFFENIPLKAYTKIMDSAKGFLLKSES